MRAHAKVLNGLAGVLGATEQEGVGAGGLLKRQLVEGLDGAAGRGDAGAGGGGDAQGGHVDLGHGQEAVVVGDGADNNDRLVLVAVLEVGRDARQRDGRAVDAAHEQAAQDHLVEGRIGAACRIDSSENVAIGAAAGGQKLTGQEAVKLHQELQVDVVALGGLAVRGPLVVLPQIDTYFPTGLQSAFGLRYAQTGVRRPAMHRLVAMPWAGVAKSRGFRRAATRNEFSAGSRKCHGRREKRISESRPLAHEGFEEALVTYPS